MRTSQIGASGVLLVQYRLLKCGIDSAPMTTDNGIDLVVYAPKPASALTVQVKACLKPKPAGGKGKLALDWFLSVDCPAQLICLANLESDQARLFSADEFTKYAQQETQDRRHLYFYTACDYAPAPGRHERDFERFRIEQRTNELATGLFGVR